MPEVARKSGVDSVHSPHGTGKDCLSPATYATDVGSSKVFVEGVGVVRQGDAMQSHPAPGCAPHAPSLSTHSSKVFVENKGIGRKGDSYSGHSITSGSGKVISG